MARSTLMTLGAALVLATSSCGTPVRDFLYEDDAGRPVGDGSILAPPKPPTDEAIPCVDLGTATKGALGCSMPTAKTVTLRMRTPVDRRFGVRRVREDACDEDEIAGAFGLYSPYEATVRAGEVYRIAPPSSDVFTCEIRIPADRDVLELKVE